MRRIGGTLEYTALLGILSSTAVFAQTPSLVPEAELASPVSIRLMFGLDRHTPQRWDGAIAVSPGRVVEVGGVHFEGRDRIVDRTSWLLTNRVTRYADSTTPRGFDPVHTRQFAMIPNGVAATLDAPEAAVVSVETEQGSFSFALRELEFGKPLRFLDGSASAERIPPTFDLTAGGSYNDYPALAADGESGLWISWISYRDGQDAVWLARRDEAGWSEPIQVSPNGYGDNFRTAVAVDRNAAAVVVWSGKSPSGTWGLFARSFRDGELTPTASIAASGENVYHQAVQDSQGDVHVAWQGFRNRLSRILHARWNGSAWSGETGISGDSADSWAPAIAADTQGNVWVGWDSYDSGNFDVFARRLRADGNWHVARRITESAGFDANVALACDASGRLWLAWDQGEANWGKDWSSQRFKPGGGAGLYRTRTVKVAMLEGDRLRQAPNFMEAIPAAYRDYVQQARLAVDSEGQIWALARSLTSVTSRVDNNWGVGGIWEMLATRLDGDRWLPAAKLHATNGRNDTWAAATLAGGRRLWFAWSYDARPFGSPTLATNRPSPAARTTQVSYTWIDPAHPAWQSRLEPVVTDFQESKADAPPVHPNEEEDTARIRAYRYETPSGPYRILRGDLHRHTDISSDGIGEGGLIDFYRYALTAGQYDFMLVADHQYGGDNVPGVEYNWWRTEKSEDIFRVEGRFLPLFGTERSLPYPNGHRNTVFARRGVRWMPIQADERTGAINSGEILFPYLRRHGGISTPHTSGSDQGTDWRESDPELEPVVEIYQSLHASYEYPGAPRAETPDKRYYHHGEPWRPAGFVWEAWAKGIKIGVQASSDHVGTHDAYACVLVPADRRPTRQDLIDAMKRRRTYAATDNIILDMRISDRLMGEAFATSDRPVVRARVIGTAPIQRVDLIRNNEFLYAVTPESREVEFEFADDSVERGESYYYIRAEQADGSLAWASPIWMTYR